MKTASQIVLIWILSVITVFVLVGYSVQNGQMIDNPVKTLGTGQTDYFASVSGTGDCTSWDRACSFRTAISKCDGTRQCNVYLGAGTHDTNNGSDANGTTVSANYVRIIGFNGGTDIGQSSQLANKRLGGAGVVDYILQVTGSKFAIQAVVFDQAGQSDTTATHLRLRGSYNTVTNCLFRQAVSDGSNTGILMDNSSVSHTIEGCRFRRLEGYGINMGDASRFYVNNNVFWRCAVALYASSANADEGIFRFNNYINNTTAISLDTAVAKTWYSIGANYANNTTNFAALSAYGGTIFITGSSSSGVTRQLFPAAAVGVTVAKDAAAWTQGDYVNVMTEGTVTKPFIVTAINVQGNNASQTYRLELFYGSTLAGATTSFGNYEFQVSTSQLPRIETNMYIPARAAIRAKLASSTGGADNVVISLQYQTL